MRAIHRTGMQEVHPSMANAGGPDSPVNGPRALQSVLDVTALSIRLNGRTIVGGIAFSLPKGASLAIIGPNGSGKTLLLKTLLRLLPCSGSFHWLAGVRLGYVPQKVFADPQMPMQVRELLEAKASVQGLSSSDTKLAVNWVGIEELMEHRLGTLSSGQLQRVLIALAMLGMPDVLLVDEPTSSLDQGSEEHVYDLLERTRLTHGATIILVSHDLLLVRQLATHVLCLNAGTASFGTAEQMLRPDALEMVFGTPLRLHAHALDKR